MYLALVGTCQQGAGPPALSLSASPTNEGGDVVTIDSGAAQATGSGDIDFTASASGGDGSYSYAWTLISEDDPTNSYSINMGTVNAARWKTAVVTTTFSGPAGPGNDPPPPLGIVARCTVTDGNSDTATANVNLTLEVL
jgi:hypothetical protein|tara:strand:+ start:1193 stop:1609 length:417 start_codon:yes stop_codon:yes gene_type:complete